MRTRGFVAALAAMLLSAAGSPDATAQGRESLLPLSAFPRERIAIETRSARRHTFDAWRADTPQTRAQGLMFVRSLQPEQAMIFVYTPPQHVAMWMKNTLIPLDMLFVDADGCVVKVHERAEPGVLDTIASDVPVVVVVELAGGVANRLGLRAGDRVARPAVDWPQDPQPCTPRP
ncbi:MAG TPA: DUF192 domain-containing protein [Steroidobacteraceae bacterium]|nr:DUF192 domain-containing protein [Steroidobacteraceae bacterium]